MTFAIMESKSGGTRSPSRTPASTRIPVPAGKVSFASRPGAGVNPFSGSSAHSRASTACPRTAGGTPVSRPPRATCSCSFTRSSPVVTSVTGCSTCNRVLTSMNRYRPVSGSTRNSTVPALRYPAAVATRTAASLIACSAAGSSTVDADSSSTFWCRRCSVQSRTPTAHTVPYPSAITWTSTWRAAGIIFSRNTVGSPNANRASPCAAVSAAVSSASACTTRMPRPPPPAAAFNTRGYPSRAACAVACSASSTGWPLHGTTGTPARSATRFAAILSPSSRIVALSGPTNVMPASSHACANDARSARNPQPTHTASARARTSASNTAGSSRYRDLRPPSAGSTNVAGPSGTASSASRTYHASASGSVYSTTVVIGGWSPARLSSLTAVRARIAGSPRLTIANRRISVIGSASLAFFLTCADRRSRRLRHISLLDLRRPKVQAPETYQPVTARIAVRTSSGTGSGNGTVRYPSTRSTTRPSAP